MVIVAIPSFGNGGLNEAFCNQFGRCECFTFITIENNEIIEVRAIENPAKNEMGGAGIKAAEFVGNNNTTDVIVGFVGPNASQSLKALNIKMFKAPDQDLTVKQVVDLFIKGNLSLITSSNVMSRAGSGTRMGRGRGMGRQRRGQF